MTPSSKILQQAEEIVKRTGRKAHEECEDGFYSCPKAENFIDAGRGLIECYCEVENPKVELIDALASALAAARAEVWEKVRLLVASQTWPEERLEKFEEMESLHVASSVKKDIIATILAARDKDLE